MSAVHVDVVHVSVRWEKLPSAELLVDLNGAEEFVPLRRMETKATTQNYELALCWSLKALLLMSPQDARYAELEWRLEHNGKVVAARKVGQGVLGPTQPLDLLAAADPFAV
ncbi:MAG: hypothetical protein EXS14_07510 [Planctomycetes bacterium]|nr:hypothetical protein [Planctomycetota bacterium]